ncbi:MAG: cob(I)yrinic acid a,c-diamide adenosyltransferase [Paludibacteraceae bacterium]|nr:cob(I)yrinic acid a,c-diamide adenosyltransferase [Paludibacteraceae bacterium]
MIYTKTGDKGTTSLANGQRVVKTDARIEAYGTVDELNSWIGLLRAGVQSTDRFADRIQTELEWIQNKLFNLGAALSEAPGEWITENDVQQLEQWIDAMVNDTPKQHAFVLPVGGETVCRSHVARTVCRRAERRMIEAKSSALNLQFINRLSDYLFVLSRYFGHKNGEKEAIWCKN